MRLLILVLIISIWQQSAAQSNQSKHAQYDSETKAVLFNNESLSSFSNQDERIAFHLKNVIYELEKNLPEEPAKAR